MIFKFSMDNVTFTGIRLGNTRFEHVRDLVFHLERTGFNSFGKKKCYVSNVFDEKRAFFQFVRDTNHFADRDFGTIFLPWSKEVYIIANPGYEQLMLPVVKEFDKGAKINLLF